MNWAAFAAVVSCISLLVLISGVIFVSGKMAEKVAQNTADIKDVKELHGQRLDGHDDHLGRVDVALAKLEQYQAGFQAATKLITQHPETK